MKKKVALLLFFTVTVAIVITAFLYYNYEYKRTGDVENLSEADRVAIVNEVMNSSSVLISFEAEYYLFLSLNKDLKTLLNQFEIATYLDNLTDDFSSKTLKDEYLRFVDSANNLIRYKTMINDIGVYKPTIYDAIEFNYLSYRASLEILTKAFDIKDTAPFIPDEISSEIIKSGVCVKADETYESKDIMMSWIVSTASLRAAFDKRLYQIFYGRKYFSRNELKLIYKQMVELYNAQKKCLPPKAVELILKNADYGNILETYGLRLGLGKLLLKADEDNIDLVDLIKITLKRDSFYKLLFNRAGEDSFNTLAQLLIFNLYTSDLFSSRDITE